MTGAPPAELGFYVPPAASHTALLMERIAAAGLRVIGADGMRDDEEAEGRFSDLVQRHGFAVESMHATNPLVPPPGKTPADLIPGLLRTVGRARRWGARWVVLHFRHVALPWRPGGWRESDDVLFRMGLDAADAAMREVLAPALDAAARAGLGLAIENVGPAGVFAARVADVCSFIERQGAPHLRLCFDTGHAHCVGLDVAAELRVAGDLLGTTHVHDNVGPARAAEGPESGRRGKDLHLSPGLGTIDWVDAIGALRDIRFSGPIVFEGVLKPQPGGEPGAGAVDVDGLDEQIELSVRTWRALERLAA